MTKDQPSDIASKLRKDGANLARGMTEMVEALDRKRGKGPQVVRVERVVVQDGGQAIVGLNRAQAQRPVVGGARWVRGQQHLPRSDVVPICSRPGHFCSQRC